MGPPSDFYDVIYDDSRPSNYYYYEILDNIDNVCRRTDEESDTGLNVKR